MILLNPKKYSIKHDDKHFQQIIEKTINFFESKGLQKIKEDDHQMVFLHLQLNLSI